MITSNQTIVRCGLALVTLMAAVLMGCGGGSSSNNSGTGTGTSAGTGTGSSTGTSPSLELVAGNFEVTSLFVDGQGTAARFQYPSASAVDSHGNVFVADTFNRAIRKVSPSGSVTTWVQLDDAPAAIAIDGFDNVYTLLLLPNYPNPPAGGPPSFSYGSLTKITPQGVVTGLPVHVLWGYNYLLAADNLGNAYVMDPLSVLLSKVSPDGQVTSVAVGGNNWNRMTPDGQYADLVYTASGMAVDGAGNVYLLVNGNYIMKISPTGVIGWTKLSLPLAPLFSSIGPISAGDFYVFGSTDANDGGQIFKVSPSGDVSVLAGSAQYGHADGIGTQASFAPGGSITLDAAGDVWVTDTRNNLLRKVTPSGVVSTIAGSAAVAAGHVDGVGANAWFSGPTSIESDAAGNLYVVDGTDINPGGWIRKISPTGNVSTWAGAGSGASASTAANVLPGFTVPVGIALDSANNVYVADGNSVDQVNPQGVIASFAGSNTQLDSLYQDGSGSQARFNRLGAVAIDATGNLWVTTSPIENCSSATNASGQPTCTYTNATVRKITPQAVVSTFYNFPTLSTIGSTSFQAQQLCVGVGGKIVVTGLTAVGQPQQSINLIDGSGKLSLLAQLPVDVGASVSALACDNTGNVYVGQTGSAHTSIFKIDGSGSVTPIVGATSATSAVTLGALPGALSDVGGLTKVGTSLYFTSRNGVGVIKNVP